MVEVKGYAAYQSKGALKPFSFKRRDLRVDDVDIDILYCGICHSDVHQVADDWGGSIFPMVPGHEIVGRVIAVGENVTKFKIGDAVGVGCFVDSCETCQACHEDLEQYCAQGVTSTYNSHERDGKTVTQGGYSTRIVVKERFVVRIPENLPLDAAAPLLCAGITTYSPLRHWNVTSKSKVGVIGLGGLGHMAIKLAHAMGAEVTVFSTSEKKREDAERLGANNYVVSRDAEEMKKYSNHLDLILNTAPSGVDLEPFFQTLSYDGTLVTLGISLEAPLSVGTFTLVTKRRSLAGSLVGGLKETQEMLDFCGTHDIVSDIELITIDKVNEAYQRMGHGDVRYRFVIDIASLKN